MFPSTKLKLAVLIGKGATTAQGVATRVLNAHINGAVAISGSNILGDAEVYAQLLAVFKLLGSLATLIYHLHLYACSIELGCDGHLLAERSLLAAQSCHLCIALAELCTNTGVLGSVASSFLRRAISRASLAFTCFSSSSSFCVFICS